MTVRGNYLERNLLLSLCVLLGLFQRAVSQYAFDLTDPALLRKDMQQLYRTMDSVHFDLYHAADKEQFDSVYLTSLDRLQKPLHAFDFYWNHVLPLFQLIRDAHSAAIFPFPLNKAFQQQGGTFLPLEVDIYSNTVYIKSNLSDKDIPAYSRLYSVNQKPVEEILLDLQKLSNDERPETEEKYMSYFFPRILYWLYGYDGFFNIHLKTPSGEDRHMLVPGVPADRFGRNPEPAFDFKMLSDSIALLDINACEEKEAFASFCDSVFTSLEQHRTPYLIIDVRDNGGGSTYHGDTLFTYLTDKPFTQYGPVELKISRFVDPKADSTHFVRYDDDLRQSHQNPWLFDGHTFMLANRNSFSSAAVMAATFQCYNMGTLVGQESGGVQIFFDEPLLLELSNSHLQYLISYQFRTSPCGISKDRGIHPDFIVPWSLEDKINGVDTDIEFIHELIRKGTWKQ